MIELTGTMKKVLTYIGIGIVGVTVLSVTIAYFYQRAAIANLNKEKQTLKTDNDRISDALSRKQGEIDALATMAAQDKLSAREERLKNNALIASIEAGKVNIKTLDDKLAQGEIRYEEAKKNLHNDCADDDCQLRKLCAELRALGFACNEQTVKRSNQPSGNQ